eukprot:3173406-Amphidinium_carterae.1
MAPSGASCVNSPLLFGNRSGSYVGAQSIAEMLLGLSNTLPCHAVKDLDGLWQIAKTYVRKAQHIQAWDAFFEAVELPTHCSLVSAQRVTMDDKPPRSSATSAAAAGPKETSSASARVVSRVTGRANAKPHAKIPPPPVLALPHGVPPPTAPCRRLRLLRRLRGHALACWRTVKDVKKTAAQCCCC